MTPLLVVLAPAAAPARMMQDLTLTRDPAEFRLSMTANAPLLPAAPGGTTPTPTRQRKLSPVDEAVKQLALCSAAKKLIKKQDESGADGRKKTYLGDSSSAF